MRLGVYRTGVGEEGKGIKIKGGIRRYVTKMSLDPESQIRMNLHTRMCDRRVGRVRGNRACVGLKTAVGHIGIHWLGVRHHDV